MKCLWPSTKTAGIKTLAHLVLAVFSGVLTWCAVAPVSSAPRRDVPLTQREELLNRAPRHISEFSPVASPLDLPKCGDVRPPEALATPDPLLQLRRDELNVRVSFIVGTDGHVHSAFVLESGGPQEDQIVLLAVRSWKYRPALCNGVPTDSEARVRFRLH
jgi:TonB family protein